MGVRIGVHYEKIIIYTTTVQNRVKILNENTQKYVDVPIVETLGWVVDLGKEFIMKRLFIISLLFLSVGFGQNKNDEPNPMKGVKTQIESIYEFEEKFGEFNDIFKGETISRYDPNGNKVESSWYDSDGNLTEVIGGIVNPSPNTIPMGMKLKSQDMIRMGR